MRGMVVDDNPMARSVLKGILKRAGCDEVVEARDGLEAMTKLEEGNFAFDVVLLDWIMPELDGVSVVRRLAAHPLGRRVPIIMVTGQNDPAHVTEAFCAGVRNYVVKPFTPETIRRKIAEVTSLCQLEATAAVRFDGRLTGDVGALGFEEVVQFIQTGRRSGDLLIVKGESRAVLTFFGGQLRQARFGALRDEEAFYAVAGLCGGRFEFVPRTDDVPASVTTPTMQLLLEAMRRRDERLENR